MVKNVTTGYLFLSQGKDFDNYLIVETDGIYKLTPAWMTHHYKEKGVR